MRWSERQRAMLEEIGIRLWPAPAGDDARSAPAVLERSDARPSAVPPMVSSAAASHAARRAHEGANRPPAPPAAPLQAASPMAAHAAAVPAARGDRPVGVESMDWIALRAAVAACRACALSEGRRQTVFGVGHEHAHWMIVGEAPGEQEDIQGEPFVGKSGQLLDNMLRALGLSRHAAPPSGGEGPAADPARQVYIANTLKCRPPGNRNPAPDELAQCEPFLMRQIALVQPRVILAMGRFAVQSLLRSDEPVGRLRGRVHRVQGVPLIVTYHPAYLLRNPQDKARAWDDLCLAAATMAAASGAT